MHRFDKWQDIIAQAHSTQALEKIVSQYADCILPSEAAKLPHACQKVLETPSFDISANAVTLLQEELRCPSGTEVADLLHEIAQTFVAASTRLTQLHSLNPKSG